MRIDQFESIFRALESAGIRFMVVGGVAVVAHGVVRYTNDLDLVLAFDEANLLAGVVALQQIGFKAKQPITAQDFAKADNRRRWREEKNMLVFQMALFTDDDLPIDIFIEPPFDFELEYTKAVRVELAPDVFVPIVSVKTLIAMKRLADRPRDRDDIERLEKLTSL